MKNAPLSRGHMGLGEGVPSSRRQAPVPALMEATWQFPGCWGKDGGQPSPAGEEAGGAHWPVCLLSASPSEYIPSTLLFPNSCPQEKWAWDFALEGNFFRIHLILLLHRQVPFLGGRLRWGESDIIELELASVIEMRMRKMRQVPPGLLPTDKPPDSLPTTGQTGQGLLLSPPHPPDPPNPQPW